jgi:hypothetical protein
MKGAVEWLIDELYKQGISLYTPELIKQAKEMEEDAKHQCYLYGHEVGYKKAEEKHLEQRGYSEEDVRLAYFKGEKDSYIKGGQTKEMEDEFIQSLQQKHELNKSDKGCACYGSNSLHPCFCNTPLKDKS